MEAAKAAQVKVDAMQQEATALRAPVDSLASAVKSPDKQRQQEKMRQAVTDLYVDAERRAQDAAMETKVGVWFSFSSR